MYILKHFKKFKWCVSWAIPNLKFIVCSLFGSHTKNEYKRLQNKVIVRDKKVFASQTVLNFYWIVERHPVDHIMHQFGFQQLIPMELQAPFYRVERTIHNTVDYRTITSKHMDFWNEQNYHILTKEPSTSDAQSEEWFQWYLRITQLHIAQHNMERKHPPHK